MGIVQYSDCVDCEICIGCGADAGYEVTQCDCCNSEALYKTDLDEMLCYECTKNYVFDNFSDFAKELFEKLNN